MPQMTTEEWDKIQATFAPELRLPQHIRDEQKKEGRFLHKALNERGIKVQLKGANNDSNQMVIGLPKKHFLLIDASLNKERFEPEYILSSERDGSNVVCLWDSRAQMLQELQEMLEGVTAPQKTTKKEQMALAEKQQLSARTAELENRFGVAIQFVGG